MIHCKDFNYTQSNKLFIAVVAPDSIQKIHSNIKQFFCCYIRPPYKFNVPVTFSMELNDCGHSPAAWLNKANINYINNYCQHLELPKPKAIPLDNLSSYCSKHNIK